MKFTNVAEAFNFYRNKTIEELEQRAQAIIEYREQYGRFAAVEEAAAVPGLTEAVVAEWDGLAYVS